MSRWQQANPTSLNKAPAPSSLPNDEAPVPSTPPYNIEAMNEGMASSGVKA